LSGAGYTGGDAFKVKDRLVERVLAVTGPNGKKVKEKKLVREVAFWSRDYQERSRKERAAVIEKSRNAIAKGELAAAKAHSNVRYVKDTPANKETGECASHVYSLDEAKIADDEALDGYYAIITSEVEKTASEVIEIYRGLWRIEETFRVTKSTLDARPVYVSRHDRIHAHFLICYVALVLLRLIQADLGWRHSAGALAEAMANMNGVLAQKNYYLFGYRTELTDELGRLCGIDLSRRLLSAGQMRDILASTKKSGIAQHKPCSKTEPFVLVDRHKRLFLAAKVRVLHEDGREAKQKSYMWLYRSAVCENRQIALYDYQASRGFSCARDFLQGFSGICHADGYKAYRKLKDVVLIGCWAHARRRFAEALEAIDGSQREGSVAAEGLRYINTLFSLERDFMESKLTVDERLLARQQKSLPVAISMINWVNSLHVLPKSLTGRALTYMREQWPYLKEALLHGECEISNNRAERSIKPFVIGRKNWLFSNTAAGARASAVIYSVIETAKASGLIPESYLSYLLEQLPNTTTCALDDLMPWSTALPADIKILNVGDRTANLS
jgi:hypothetical protein